MKASSDCHQSVTVQRPHREGFWGAGGDPFLNPGGGDKMAFHFTVVELYVVLWGKEKETLLCSES